jgi:hypothetical protein
MVCWVLFSLTRFFLCSPLVAGQHAAISFVSFPSFLLSVCLPVLVTRATVEMVHAFPASVHVKAGETMN